MRPPLFLAAGAVLKASALHSRIVYDLEPQGDGEPDSLQSQDEGRSYSLDSFAQDAPGDSLAQGESGVPAENLGDGEWQRDVEQREQREEAQAREAQAAQAAEPDDEEYTTTAVQREEYTTTAEPDLYDGRPRRPGCYMRMLSGCPKSPLRSEAWRHDTWAEEHGLDEAGCNRRKHTWDKHCGAQDAELLYLDSQTAATWNLGVPPAAPAETASNLAQAHADANLSILEQAYADAEADEAAELDQAHDDGVLSETDHSEQAYPDAEADEAAKLDQAHDDGALSETNHSEQALADGEADEAAKLDQAHDDGVISETDHSEQAHPDAEADEAGKLDRAHDDGVLSETDDHSEQAHADAESDEAAKLDQARDDGLLSETDHSEQAHPDDEADEAAKLDQAHDDGALSETDHSEQAHADAEADEAAKLDQAHDNGALSETERFEQAHAGVESDDPISDEAFKHDQAHDEGTLSVLQSAEFDDFVTYPTESGCFMRMPSGCPNKPMRTMSWRHDAWAEDNNLGEESCKNRKKTWNTYCGTTDARIAFVPKQ